MKVSCIILNYNDADTTLKLVKEISGYEALDSIVVVDNCSTDDSAKRLKSLNGGKIHVLHSKKNGGYGSGNNLGIRYAAEELHATHVLVANPDVCVSEECICAMKKAFGQFEGLAVAAAVAKDPKGRIQPSSWSLNGLWGDLLDTGLLTRRLFAKRLNRSPGLCPKGPYAFVDAVLGSLFMADARALLECGLYDEEVFLYYEEKILGIKLKNKGFKTVLLLDQSYIHNHSVSIDKSVKSIQKKQALRYQSQLYYYQHYLGMNRLEECFVRAALGFIMAEIWFLTEVLKWSW